MSTYKDREDNHAANLRALLADGKYHSAAELEAATSHRFSHPILILKTGSDGKPPLDITKRRVKKETDAYWEYKSRGNAKEPYVPRGPHAEAKKLRARLRATVEALEAANKHRIELGVMFRRTPWVEGDLIMQGEHEADVGQIGVTLKLFQATVERLRYAEQLLGNHPRIPCHPGSHGPEPMEPCEECWWQASVRDFLEEKP